MRRAFRHDLAAAPAAVLAPYVVGYWGFARAGPARHRITPDRFVEVLIFAAPPEVCGSDGTRATLPACTLIPLLDGPLEIAWTGELRCACVRLQAWAAGIIFPPADAPARTWYDGTERFGDVVPAVRAALHANAWTSIAALFDAALQRIFGAATPATVASRFAGAFERERADGESRAAIADVARERGLSRRQIERHVRAATRRSPKALASLARFQYVRDTLWERPGIALAELAQAAGYADQAHLSRQFRRYAAQSPTAFVRDCARLRAVSARDRTAT